MGKVIKKKIQGMSWITKTSLVLLLTLAASVFMYQGWYLPNQAQTAITVSQAWTKVYDAASSPGTPSFTVTAPSGSGRLMVVAVTTGFSAGATATTTVSFGATAMTQQVGDDTVSMRMHSNLFYLTDAQISAGPQTLTITSSGGTVTNLAAYVAVFTGVDQTTPITNSQNYNNNADSTTAAFATALTVNANDQAIYVSNIFDRTVATIPTYTLPANWTSGANSTGTNGTYGWATEVCNRAIPASNTTDTANITAINPVSRPSMSGMSLKAGISLGNLSITNGTNPTGGNAAQASTNNAMDGFSLFMSVGTGTVNTLTLTGSAQFTSANVAAIRLYRDNGTVGLYQAGTDVLVPTTTGWAANVATLTITTPESVTTATGNYLVVVDLQPGATVGNTLSGTITAATGTIGTPSYNDSSSATLTVTAGPGLVVANGTNPANANASRSSTNNALDSFTMATTTGAATINTLTLTGNANFTSTNVTTPNGVKVYRDAGTLGVLDGADTLIPTTSSISGTTATITFTTPESISTTTQNYLVVIDIPAAATLTNTLTGTITAATGAGYIGTSFTDSASATLTITPIQTLTVGNGTNPVTGNAKQNADTALDAFTLAVNTGSATVNTLTLNGSANFTTANIAGVKVYADIGVVGTFEPAIDTLIPTTYGQAGTIGTITFTTPEPVTVTAKNYLVVVTVAGSATLTQTFTGTITAATGTGIGTPVYSDASSATLTIIAGPIATITNCGGCHGYPGGTNTTFDGTRGAGLFPGTHNVHVNAPYTYVCTQCHRNNIVNDHQNGRINMANPINGVTGARYNNVTSFPMINSAPVFGTCNSTKCHGQKSPVWASTSSTTQCTKCHGQANYAYLTNYSTAQIAPGGSGRDTGGKTLATDARVGAHQTHLTASDNISSPIHCGECHTTHTTVTDATHLNFTTATITFGPLAKTLAHAPTVTRTAGIISCNTTYCHTAKENSGSAMTPSWVDSTYMPATITIAGCSKCHGFPPVPAGGHPSATAPAGFPIGAGNNCSCHSNLSTAGSTYATIFVDKTKHIDGIIQATGGHAYPYPGGSPQHKTDAGTTWASCSCHTTTGTGTLTAYATWVAGGHVSKTAPNCSVCHINGLANASCSQCHGAAANNGTALAGKPGVAGSNVFPNISGSHSVHMAKIAGVTCSNCHSGYGSGSIKHGFANTTTTNKTKVAGTGGRLNFVGLTTTPTWVPASNSCNNTCHGSGAVWGGKLGCIDCHSSAQGTRSAITPEFGLAYGHKKTGRGAVKDADCIVCHLEGNYATQRKDPTYHLGLPGGNIDLRDPLGAGETPITNLTGGAFTFTKFAISYAAGSRTSAPAANDIPQVISIKFCLACHSATGATNPTARSNNGGTGTAMMPFGGINIGANYTVANGAAAAGGVVNVNDQFATTNSSVHPVRGPLNRDFPIASRLAAPYNNQGAGRVAAGYTKSLSVVLNCFDCHNTAALLTTRTISAHGTNGAQVRGTFYVNGPTLCTACHSGYTTSSNTHGSGSAMNTGVDGGEAMNSQCANCHSSQLALPARPIPAQDYHGYNSLRSGGLWPTVNSRPYAFIRAWTTGASNYHRPYRASEFTTGTATCGGGGACPGGGNVGDGGTRTYTPGGSY